MGSGKILRDPPEDRPTGPATHEEDDPSPGKTPPDEGARSLHVKRPTKSKHYCTDIPLLGYTTVTEASQPAPGQYPTQSPMCAVHLFDRLTTAIVDHCCVFTNVSSALLDTLFPRKWRQWVRPTREGLKSASHHSLNIIGRIVRAKIELGSVEIYHDIQVVEDDRPLFLIGNDVGFDRITNHDGRFITVRCQPGGPAREIIPITYGNQIVYASLPDKLCIRPRTAVVVQASLVSTTGGKEECKYVNSFRDATVNIENIRYGPTNELDDSAEPPRIDEAIATVDSELQVSIVINNAGYTFHTFEKGALVARVIRVREEKTNSGSSYFVQIETPDLPNELLAEAEREARFSSQDNASSAKANNFLLPSHHEDLVNILHGSDDGDIPLPGGYELDDIPKRFEEYKIEEIQTPHLDPRQREQILDICRQYPSAFARHSGDVGRCTYGEFDMTVGDKILKPEAYRPCPKAYVEEVDEIIQGMTAMKVVGPSDSPYATNLVIARRPNSKLRVCLDSRGVNLHLKNLTAWPIPSQEESLEKLATANISSSLDILRAFWSIPLSDRARPLTAFYWKAALMCFLVAPFGIKSLPGYFNMLMAHLLRNLSSYTYFFFDDLLVFSLTFEDHLGHFKKVLQRICESGFKLRPNKCQIGVPKSQPLQWLGNIVVNNQLLIDPVKIKAVQDLPIPQTGKELLRGLSLVSYLRKFLPHLATVVAPLNDLVNAALRKVNPEYRWLPIHTERFTLMKNMVTHAPALRLIINENPLIVCSDASREACGGLLAMIHDENDGKGPQEYVCGYVSRRFTSAEKKRLTIPEREMTGILYAINCWSQHLVGRDHFILQTDASALLYLHKFKESSPRLMKASLHLQELNYEIQHVSAKDGNGMQVCDFLSRAYAEIPEITLSWQSLRNSCFDQIRPPQDWPKQPLSKAAFATYADEYFRNFHPQFPEETKEIERMKITYFSRDIDDPIAKQKIIDKERELRQEYYRKTRETNSTEVIPTIASQTTASDLPTVDSQYTNAAEPPSTGRSTPQSHVSSRSSFFSFSGKGSEDSDDMSNSNSEDSEFRSAYDQSEAEYENTEMSTSNAAHCMVNFHSQEALTRHKEGDDPDIVTGQNTVPDLPGVGHLTPSQMTALQQADLALLRILNKLTKLNLEDRQKSPFFLRQKVLMRRMQHRNVTHEAVALPKVLRLDALRMVHGDGLGTEHLGLKKTLILTHRLFYWPRMADDIKTFVAGCVNCTFNQPTTLRQVDIQRRMATPSMTTNSSVSVDLIINLPTTVERYRHIACFVDNFSRFIVAAPLRTKKPEEVARAFLTRYIGVIGLPENLHSDAGTEVDSSFMQRFCKVLAIRKTRTPSWTPNSNAIVETMNKSIGSLLRTATFPGHLAKSWPALLPFICLSLNETPSTVHGFRPRQLMFGYTPSYVRLPLVSWESPVIGQEGFFKATRAGQQFAWDIVRAQQMRVHTPREKARRRHPFRVGDFVVIKDHEIGAPGTNHLKKKYKGPFRILHAYEVSLVVQKWLGADDPLVTQGLLHHHRMDAKHIECRIVNARDCKKYPKLDNSAEGPGVNPQLIRMFLKQLGHKINIEEATAIREDEGPYEWDADPEAIKAIESNIDSRSDSDADQARRPPNPSEPLRETVPPQDPNPNRESISQPLVETAPLSTASASSPHRMTINPTSTPQPETPVSPPKDVGPAQSEVAATDSTNGLINPNGINLVDPNDANNPNIEEKPLISLNLSPEMAADASVASAASARPDDIRPDPERNRRKSAPASSEPASTSDTANGAKVSEQTPGPNSPVVLRRQPGRAAKSEWRQNKWPQVLAKLKPRSRRNSAPQHPQKPTTVQTSLTRDLEKSKKKNDPDVDRTPASKNPGETGIAADRTLYDQRIAHWITQETETSDFRPAAVGTIVTQHERDEQSHIINTALGKNSPSVTRSNFEENDLNPDVEEELASAPSYVNVP